MNRLNGHLLTALCFILASCAHVPEKGTKRVAVIDSESGKPVGEVPLVYHFVEKPYWIVGQVVESKHYVSDENGIAFVPEQKKMHVAMGSEWTSFTMEPKLEQSRGLEIYYVTRTKFDQVGGINSESLRSSP